MNCNKVILKESIGEVSEKLYKEYNLSNDELFILKKIMEKLENHPPELSLQLCSKLISGPVLKEKYSNLDNPI